MKTPSGKGSISLLIGTRKGAFILSGDKQRKKWSISEPIFLGHIVYHLVPDYRNNRHAVMAAKTGHLGPTVYYSEDGGKAWTEATTPPQFPKVPDGAKGRVVESVFWLSAGPANEPGVWYAGTSPPGLFRSENGGRDWQPVDGFNKNAAYSEWTQIGPTPGGQLLHSILIDPENPKQMYLGISVGGIFESSDGGKNWQPMNKGVAADFLPDPNAEYGHDPHCIVLHPLKPSRLYHQNHCGIYTIERPSREWTRIGKNMPAEIGDIGFPIVVHPREPETAWVFPMDGTTVWPRTSPGGKPCVYVTKDAGKSWQRQDSGLPAEDAYFTVKRQAMTADDCESVGLYFGTSQGEIWGSIDEGKTWSCLVRFLPEIYSLTVTRG